MKALMRRDEDRRPWGLIVLLLFGGTAGLLSLPLQVATFRNVDAASRADVERNRELTLQVRMLQEMGNADVEQHRDRNELLHACIVELALSLADPNRDPSKPIPNPCPPPIMPGAPGG